MADDTASPALRDDELPETLERLIQLTLTLSDQVDEQTKAINKGTSLANEARHAADAARKQTDPKAFGQLVGEVIDGEIDENLGRMARMATDLLKVSNHTQEVLKKAETDQSAAQRTIWEREQKLDQFKARLPWFSLGAVVLALTMTLLLPRFLASNATACAVLGASWTTTTTGANACVFYLE
tara:strand:+ start:1323 stop:1871 length:549 start_codon:yes stop_codon:yes gene_type:complete